MTKPDLDPELEHAASDIRSRFERVLGVNGVETVVSHAGGQPFIKLKVGRRAPYYEHALHTVQLELQDSHPFKGRLGLVEATPRDFPNSLEAECLLTLLTRATRKVSQGNQGDEIYSVPYVPFQNGEDFKLTQPASHLIIGRRGVGKSTLISRAIQILQDGKNVAVVLDMQPYSELTGETLYREVFYDVLTAVVLQARALPMAAAIESDVLTLEAALKALPSQAITSVPVQVRRIISRIVDVTKGQVFLFLDDFHVIAWAEQPTLLQHLHGAVKGANGWLKVAGLGSLLNHYDPRTRHGLQVPGDAQRVSLDLTLENPRAAEHHLESIVTNFVKAVGLASLSSALAAAPFRRLVWANAGVPRDFLQMFARSLELARKSARSTVALTDVNVAIGEFGQQKIDEMQADARNEQGALERVIQFLEKYCLDEKKTNAFLVRSDKSDERRSVQILSDLRLLHLIHQSITPNRAGERYEAFIIDYALFTGFRRRPGIAEMLPEQGDQFKASALRTLPKLPPGFVNSSSGATLKSDRPKRSASDRGSRGARKPRPRTAK